jgi:3-oxoacyl-[acyl-carrier-protein] synthase III
MTDTPGIASIGYAFPAETRTVRELGAAGQLHSDAGVLERFGFEHVHVGRGESPYSLGMHAARVALRSAHMKPESIDAVIYAGTPGALAFESDATAQHASASLRTMNRFKYPATRLQYDLGLTNACAFGIDQLACASLLGAVRIARALCIAEGLERVLCVSSEFFPADAGREALFNCTSDAACAVVVERTCVGNRIIASTQVTKGYYWDCDARHDEIVASYFPTSKHVIEETIARAGWTHADVSWVIPHNVSTRSWEILLGLVQLPFARIWTRNIARDGHTLAGDNFINLKDALDAGAIQPGEKLLLFSYGFGAHWTALALEA